MKKKIRPYIKFLLKENVAYIAVFITALVIGAVLIPVMSGRIANTNIQIDSLQREVTTLHNKEQTLNSVVNESAENLNDDLALVNKLIPDSEDYFSMIYSLEQLSQSTGFLINSYTVNLTKSTANKLSLSVTGVGDSATFLKLLQEYNVGGGRLITAEKIGVDPTQIGSITLVLNFYNKKADTSNEQPEIFRASINELKTIKAKLSIVPVSSTPSAVIDTNTSYPTKTSPF